MSRRMFRLASMPIVCLVVGGLMAPIDAQEGASHFGIRKARLSAAGRLKATSRSPEESTASDMLDPAFARYVDLNSIGEALLEGDAAALTDAALALAEGERVLLRSHNSLTVAEVASAATRLAAEQKDAESLKRLSALAEQRGDKELVASIKAAEKLARTLGSTRSIDQWTPERLGDLPGPVHGQLEKLLADTREALPEQRGATDTQLSALEKLADAARGDEETIVDADSSGNVTGGF